MCLSEEGACRTLKGSNSYADSQTSTRCFGGGRIVARGILGAGADQNQQGQGQAVVTVLSGDEIPGGIPQDDLAPEGGRQGFQCYRLDGAAQPESQLEVVMLIDDGARASLGTQLNDIAKFIKGLPPNAEVAVAYMENGRAALAAPLTTDHAAAVSELHLPLEGHAGRERQPLLLPFRSG